MLSPNPVLTELLTLYLMRGVRKFISLLHYALLFLTRLLSSVSVVVSVSIQMFYVSKADTGTRVLPWPVPLLSLGRQDSVSGMNPVSLCFGQDTYIRVS